MTDRHEYQEALREALSAPEPPELLPGMPFDTEECAARLRELQAEMEQRVGATELAATKIEARRNARQLLTGEDLDRAHD